ncbi:MAG: hypothetical protein HY397_00390, partial [Candidatus Doudnabacteria bacterium]|nr:hypothetical protein [Candidatus Doudnabacteria bacterium]
MKKSTPEEIYLHAQSFVTASVQQKTNESFSDNALKMMKKRYLQLRPDGAQ